MNSSLISPLPGILFDPPGLLLIKSRTLVISDLHLGAENAFHNKGYFIPKTQSQIILNRSKELIKKHKVKKVVIAGDLKHALGNILDDEWKDIRSLIQLIKNFDAEIIIIKGNHDNILLPILKKENLELHESTIIDNYYIVHGDKKINKDSLTKEVKGIIIGHEHPSLELDDGVRKEKYKCLLKGKYEEYDLLIMPSMYPLVEGTDILTNYALGPIRKKAKHLEAYLIENNKAYSFGSIKSLQSRRQKV